LRFTSGEVSTIAASAKLIRPTFSMLVSVGCSGPPLIGLPAGRIFVPASRQARRNAGREELRRDGELMVGSGTVRTRVRCRGSERGEHTRLRADDAEHKESMERDDGGPLSKSVLRSLSSSASTTSRFSQLVSTPPPCRPGSSPSMRPQSLCVTSLSPEPSTRQTVSLAWRERAGLASCSFERFPLPSLAASAACSTTTALDLPRPMLDQTERSFSAMCST